MEDFLVELRAGDLHSERVAFLSVANHVLLKTHASFSRISTCCFKLMEAVAAFVFASGGVARPDELHDLFEQQPAVRAQLPLAALKRAVARDGAAHGLAWRDAHPQERGAVVAHALTTAQRTSGAFAAEARRVPRALDALEQLVQARATRQLRSGALSDFYRAFPLESAFMKRRSGGVVAFVQQYDPAQRRLCWDDRGGLCVPGARADSGGAPVGTAPRELADGAHATRTRKHAAAAEPAPEPESESKRTRADAQCPSELPPSDAVSSGKSPDELRLVACASPAASRRLPRRLPPRAASAAAVLAFPRVLWAVGRVSGVLTQARAAPRLHPIAFLVVVFERKQRAREDRRVARRAAPVESGRALEPPPTPADGADTLETAELLPAPPRELTFEGTLSVLLSVSAALQQATSLPAPHPLVVRLVAWGRWQQSRRAARAARRSKALERHVIGSLSFLLVPRATLELLTFSGRPPQAPAGGTVQLD